MLLVQIFTNKTTIIALHYSRQHHAQLGETVQQTEPIYQLNTARNVHVC